MSQYGERLNNYRKRVYQLLGTKAAISSIVPIIEIETRRFLLRTMINPSSLKEQLQRSVHVYRSWVTCIDSDLEQACRSSHFEDHLRLSHRG